MKRKTMVRLDNDTINSQVIQNVLTTNQKLSAIDRHIYMFEFDDTVFTHALMLLGSNSNRFGYDLQYYLNNIPLFMSRTLPNEYISLDRGTPDFKRRASEDFGVALSSLFMVESFKIRWENISQIPQNRKLSKFTPDFIAISGTDRYVYESKGTTQADRISKAMTDASNQKRSYTERTKDKFAFVSYLPNNTKIFPTFMFIADPPASEFMNLDDWHFLMLHYKNVLEYSHFTETLPIFIKFLRQKIKIEMSEEVSYRSRVDQEVENLKRKILQAFERDSENLSKLSYQNLEFLGKLIKIDRDKLKIFLGVESNLIKNILNFRQARFLENRFIEETNRRTSIFSDGTIFDLVID